MFVVIIIGISLIILSFKFKILKGIVIINILVYKYKNGF